MQGVYDTVVLGATFSGLGAAYAGCGRTLVIERRSNMGYEFIACLNPGSGWNETRVSDIGGFFKKELYSRGILSPDGLVHLPALEPLLSRWVKDCSFSVLLLTEVIKIKKVENTYEIQIYNSSGFGTIKACNIVDTLGNPLLQSRVNVGILSKSINAMLYGDTTQEPVLNNQQAQILKGKLSGEYILKYPLEIEDNWITARKKLHEFWLNRPSELKPWTLAYVANSFDMCAEKGVYQVYDTWNILPCYSFNNPLEALEVGAKFARERNYCHADVL